MSGKTNLHDLLKTLEPYHHTGDYVFCNLADPSRVKQKDILMLFKEEEGFTIIIKKEIADNLLLQYSFVASWITLKVHSSLEAVGLTAAFSSALAKEEISCNVIAAYYHDHIFVNKKDITKAMSVLHNLS